MTELYKNKYRVESARLKNWDYSSPGGYFITICTKNRELYLGKIVNDEMVLSEMGQIVNNHWREIPIHFPHAQLDEFVVMPNHFHGIIKIENNVETPKLGVSTKLGVIINQYKRICTIQIKKHEYDFAWQSRFYDHIIRNDDELNLIRQYIINNPMNWHNDDHYSRM
jgi:putative transposase